MAVHRPTRGTATERLYADGHFNTDPDDCETYGRDLVTGGAAHTRQEYRADRPRTAGRSSRPPSTAVPPKSRRTTIPLLLTTGRTVYHFHTRTKTGARPAAAGRRPRSCGSR